jgi:CyaY protein
MSAATPAPSATAPASSPLSDTDYQRLTHALLSSIEATLDRWLQDDVIDIDAQRTGGLLEMSFPNGSKIIVNTQPPLHELWLAAKGGGYHYKWDGQCWRDTRDGGEFLAALSDHASRQGGQALQFPVAA